MQADEESDEHLMDRVCRQDHEAFTVLVRRHNRMFYNAAYRMLGNGPDSEDVVQDAFLKLWNNPSVWDKSRGAKFTTWFYRVVTNLAIDRLRRKKNQSDPKVLDFIADERANVEADMRKTQEEQAIEDAIQSLPARQKAALNLCFYEGLSNKEAATALGVKVKALESLLMRAKAGVRDMLIGQGLIDENDGKSKNVG